VNYGFKLEGWKAALFVFWILWSSTIAIFWVLGVLK
jgi:hypothetical protein